jgi:RNA polymerase subunit RPABC4/transcription elongation factor Spt4
LTLFLQMVGRVMRPACLSCRRYAHPTAETCPSCGRTEIKRVGRIHDHAGCILEHGAPDDDRDYSLEADTRKKKSDEDKPPPLRTCEQCLRIYESIRAQCPGCGHANASQRKPPREVEGTAIPLEELVRLKALDVARRSDKRRYLAELRATALAKGFKPKWIGIQFKERFGHWPRGNA